MLNEQIARNVGPSRVDLAYETRGNPADPSVLLIMGVGGQLVNWPEGFLDRLVSRGLRVIRFDNRDSGHSTHISDALKPDLPAALAGDFASVSYTLSEMAADSVGLLDFLDIPAAHIVGASMGGAIAQMIAIEHPGRVLSLTSMMFSTGARSVGEADPETLHAVFSGPPAVDRGQVVERAVRAARIVGSPAYPPDPLLVAERAGLAWDRSHDDVATTRQAVATIATGDRTDRLRGLDMPVLVIHGTQDKMCDVSGGRATAEAIPGAELVLIDGMGHDLPRQLWDRIVDSIASLVARTASRRVVS